jgi:glycosyltransferase involved in cell wall biosynthesis
MIHFIHDWIVHHGGAEAVLKEYISQYATVDSRIFVLYSNQKFLSLDWHDYPIITALPIWINKIFYNSRWSRRFPSIFDYRNLMPLYPVLCWLLRRKIINALDMQTIHTLYISSFAVVKNIIPPYKTYSYIHIHLYLHSPMQYIWGNYEEYIQKLIWRKKMIFRLVSTYLRPRDKQSRHYDTVVSNSHYTAWLAKQLYWISSSIHYPTIAKQFYITTIAKEHHIRDYYIFVGRIVMFVRELDRIIALANELKFPLLIVGDGPDKSYLESIAWDTVHFIGRVDDVTTKIDLIKHARGYINLAKESCGIGTMEALLCWVPIFGYNQWGTTELVDTESGILVENKNHATLIAAWSDFISKDRDRNTIKTNIMRKLSPQ